MSELQLEVGKSYVARDGSVVKIVGYYPNFKYQFEGDDERSYLPNGIFIQDAFDEKDLISEVADSDDSVNHPPHYTSHPSGIECIQVTEHMGFCIGNAIKYLWRADLKHDAVEDMRKAIWYIEREIERRESAK